MVRQNVEAIKNNLCSYSFLQAHFHPCSVDSRCSEIAFSYQKNMYILLSFCSYVFWMGDLNYRINETIENIKGLCAKQEYSTLWEHDQVRNYENMAISDSGSFRTCVLQKLN